MKDPSKYVKQLVDPVGKKKFKPTASSPKSTTTKYGTFLFASAANKATFDKDPAKYAKYGK